MKKFSIFLLMLSFAACMLAQDRASVMKDKNIFNHMDVGVNVGTMGIGIDVAMPVGDYVRIRAGYNYMPRFTINSDFNVETRSGGIGNLINKVGRIDDKLAEYGIDLNSPGFEEYKEMFEKFRNVEAKDYVTAGMKPCMHQFKFMIDVLPFRNNKHWSFTAGFFAGPSTVADACSLDKETLILEGINAYNGVYAKYPNEGINYTWLHTDGNAKDDPFYRYGVAGFNLGTFADGDKALMIPGKDNKARAEMQVSKIRPYIGFGYNTHLSKNKKWLLNVDAGVMFLCGEPKIYVDNVYKIDASPIRFDDSGKYLGGIGFDDDDFYYGDIVGRIPGTYTYGPYGELRNHVDLVRDLKDIPGKAGNAVDFISKVKVYPNLSIGISYRIF